MKKVFLLFVISFSILGYSQNPIQPNIPNFEDGLPQDLVEKMKPMNLEFGDGEMMNFNPIKKGGLMESKSFQRVVMVENNNSNTLRLDSFSSLRYYSGDGFFFSGSINDKTDMEFDDNGNQTLYIDYYWNTNTQSFVPYYKSEFSFDENGNQTLWIVYDWNTNTQSFVPRLKYEHSFDENGNQTLSIYYNWDSESQSFVPISKSESTYDENGNQTLFIQYIWDSVIEVFYEFSKEMKSYDEFGYVLDYEIHNWIQELNQMKPVNKTVYSTLSETETNLVREGIIYEYDTNFNTWNELEGEEFKSYFYYTKTSSLSTNSVELNSFSIYPNPTKGYLKINSSESLINPFFELYDIKGSKIFSKPFNFSEPIDVNGLKPSIYLYKIIDGNEVKQSGKVIKE